MSNPEMNMKRVSHSNDNVYSFLLTDSAGEPLDLNGLNMSFSLVFFRKNDYYELNRNYLALQLLKGVVGN